MSTSLAPKRDLKKIFGFAIHHAAVAGAKNEKELKSHASSYDKTHSFRDYNGDGKNDAQYTGGELGYKWILYHWMIARDGYTLAVQKPDYRRYHASDSARGSKSFNEYGLGILLDGNFESEKPTEAQLRAASKIIYDWEKKYGIDAYVRGHKETAVVVKNNVVYYPEKTGVYYTECPGKNMGIHTSGGVKTIITYVNQRHKNGGLTDAELKEKQDADAQQNTEPEAPSEPETEPTTPTVPETPTEPETPAEDTTEPSTDTSEDSTNDTPIEEDNSDSNSSDVGGDSEETVDNAAKVGSIWKIISNLLKWLISYVKSFRKN